MRGKEALKQLEQKYTKYITEWYYMSNMSKEERDRLYKMYDEEIKIIDDELTKYKRAFEILKRELNIQIFFDNEWDEPMWVLDGGGNKEITQEEYELLEELLND